MAARPISAVGNRRPVSEYARMAAAMGGNPRYKGENILQVYSFYWSQFGVIMIIVNPAIRI